MSDNNFTNGFEFLAQGETPAFEIVNFLKNKLKKKIDEYETTIKEKDKTIEALNGEIESLKQTIESLKNTYSETQSEILSQNKELFLKMKESKQILLRQKEKHQKEITLLKDIFDRTKSEIKTLSEELDSLKKEREKLRKEAFDLRTQKTLAEDKLKAVENQLSQSKKAVEQTLSELLDERRKTQELSKKITEAQKENEDLKKRLESTKLAWDSERAEWKEMWERERSLWESHRMEFAVWEERLRAEREAWLKNIKEQEEKGVEGAKSLVKVLEDASKWSYKVTELLKIYANKGIELPQVFTSAQTVEKKAKKGANKILALTATALIMLSVGFYFARDYSLKLRFSKISSYTLDDPNYTGFVKKGNWFVFSGWSDGLVFKDENMNTLTKISEFDGIKPKISAIAQEGYDLWILDLSGLRFIKINPEDGKIIKSFKTAGVAPQGLAFDGMYLWSFDASTGLLYRYELNGEVKGVSSYNLDGIKNIDWLGWAGDKLYVLSNSKLYRFKYSGDKFSKISAQKAKNFVYCYLYNDEFYAMKDNNGVKEIEIFKIKNIKE
ncbi:MAG TPA: hypothetical protein PK103_06375 [Elusimicrobiales bacterium]|nr:hypothetical protein [Elusimicrobiales bacterium]